MNFEIFPAETDDLIAAAAMRAAMAQEMGGDWEAESPGWQERYVDYFKARQLEQKSQVFLARSGTELLGMTTVSIFEDYHSYVRHKTSGRVNAVYVIPAQRRKGIASALMQAGIEWLKGKGCVGVRLHSSEEGQALYLSLGFKTRRELELLF